MSEKQFTAHDSGASLALSVLLGERLKKKQKVYEVTTCLGLERISWYFPYLRLYDMFDCLSRNAHSVLMLGAGGCSYPYLVARHPGFLAMHWRLIPRVPALACSTSLIDRAIQRGTTVGF